MPEIILSSKRSPSKSQRERQDDLRADQPSENKNSEEPKIFTLSKVEPCEPKVEQSKQTVSGFFDKLDRQIARRKIPEHKAAPRAQAVEQPEQEMRTPPAFNGSKADSLELEQ